ncbi:MAG: hypothetical protein NXI21_02615 [Alphaproteobacteria bacterium]|nr:hypothetical protein [Alphaproteobacteria bacterium]
MNIPEWIKPGLIGAGAGAAAIMVVGFSWGGWVTESAAQKMAAEQAQQEVVAALAPICLEQSRQDPRMQETLAKLQAASSYKRRDMVIETGWATMPGADEASRAVASACLDQLAERF